jgi:hypothetical protein
MAASLAGSRQVSGLEASILDEQYIDNLIASRTKLSMERLIYFEHENIGNAPKGLK